jgi:rare lipoprotein A
MPTLERAAAGFSVQLGAFASNANARSFLDHVQNQLASSAVEPRIREVEGLYRVYVGPYPSRDEARRVAERLERAFGFATALTAH